MMIEIEIKVILTLKFEVEVRITFLDCTHAVSACSLVPRL